MLPARKFNGTDGAHDADRTRDLVLTKDVLYQLSYVGIRHVMRHRLSYVPLFEHLHALPVTIERPSTVFLGAGDGI